MARISVCAECFFTDLPFEERLRKIADIGYKYIEFWHPEGTFNGSDIDFAAPKDARSLKKTCEDAGLRINDFAFGAWDGCIGGNATDKSAHPGYIRQISRMLDFAKAVGCPKGIILSGLVQRGLTPDVMTANLLKVYARAAEMAEAAGVTLLLEPLNSLVDHPGYYLDRTEEAVRIVRSINSANLRLLYDVYHMQIMQGNILGFIEKNIDIIGHFHSAGVPGRAELFDCEVNYPEIIRRIDKLGYEGCFGLEYFPKIDHAESLKRTLEYLS